MGKNTSRFQQQPRNNSATQPPKESTPMTEQATPPVDALAILSGSTSTAAQQAPADTSTNEKLPEGDDAKNEQKEETTQPPAPVVSPAPVVEVTAPIVVSTPAPVQMPAAAVPYIQTPMPANLSTTSSLLLQTLTQYMEDMAPRKPIDPSTGVRHQTTLYRTILGIINNTGDEFQPVFGTMLKLFEEKKTGVFDDTHIFRFFDRLNLDEKSHKAFRSLLNLIKIMAPVKGRELNARQLDFELSLKYGVTELGRQRVLAFFNQG